MTAPATNPRTVRRRIGLSGYKLYLHPKLIILTSNFNKYCSLKMISSSLFLFYYLFLLMMKSIKIFFYLPKGE